MPMPCPDAAAIAEKARDHAGATDAGEVARAAARRALLMLPLAVVAWIALAHRLRAQERGIVDSRSVESVLARQGFREVDRVQRRGGLWIADASAPEGRRIRAVVDATTGELAGLRPIDGSPVPLRPASPRP